MRLSRVSRMVSAGQEIRAFVDAGLAYAAKLLPLSGHVPAENKYPQTGMNGVIVSFLEKQELKP